MDSWGPVDVDLDGTEDEEYEWNDDVMKDFESRFEELRQHNKKFNDSCYKDVKEEASIFIDSTRHDIEELVANEIYDKLSILLNNTRKKFGRPIDPLTLFRPGGGLETPQRLSFITLRAFEIILRNLVTFPKIYWEIR